MRAKGGSELCSRSCCPKYWLLRWRSDALDRLRWPTSWQPHTQSHRQTAEVAPTDAPQDDTQSDNTTELPDYDEHYSPHVSDISLAAGESVTVDVIDMAHEGARLPESAKLQSVEIVNQDLSDAVDRRIRRRHGQTPR